MMRQVVSVLTVLATASMVQAVPADGSYEGDVAPDKASPAWSAWKGYAKAKAGESLLEWVTVKDGILSQKTGAPSGAGMALSPNPLKGTTYTVEFKFRISQADTSKSYSYPFVCYLSKSGGGYHGFQVGQMKKGTGFLRGSCILRYEWTVAVKDDSVIKGKWQTVRVVVDKGTGGLKANVYRNGELIQQVATPQTSSRSEFFFIRSDDENDAWELDYIRWANQAVPNGSKLEVPLSDKERAQRDKKRQKKKLDSLFE